MPDGVVPLDGDRLRGSLADRLRRVRHEFVGFEDVPEAMHEAADLLDHLDRLLRDLLEEEGLAPFARVYAESILNSIHAPAS